MNPERCQELDKGLRDPRWLSDPDGLMRWLDGLTGIESCIAAGLRQARESADWLTFERYVLAAHRHPSRSYVDSLCAVLNQRNEDVNNEDIVDVLGEIADPIAIDCLKEAIWWQPSWDEFRQLAIKAVWALAAVNTPEAIKALEDVASIEAEPVRQEVARVLGTRE